ncbi:hypothetical protein BC827DRAFT_1265926 [Russula dissimulans]|nr:hypothetical protein BC827DRAFT_1265926 [Russula dissimulans]
MSLVCHGVKESHDAQLGSGFGGLVAQAFRLWAGPCKPLPLSDKEAETYYAGLPSRPVLVARTGALWEAPRGPEVYTVIKELHPVGNHPLTEVWEGNLALKLHTFLDSMEVMWTSTDVVRIGVAGEYPVPVILWIGVMPGSLSHDDGTDVASKCQELLIEYDITDVNVELRESVVTRSARPKLLTVTSPYSSDPIPDICEPLTTTLSLPICAQSTRWAEGTGGFFITEGENTERLLLVTARHVVFTLNEDENQLFEHKNDSQSCYNITLFGDAAFNKYLKSIQDEIERNDFTAQYHEDHIRMVEGNNNISTFARSETPNNSFSRFQSFQLLQASGQIPHE